MQEKEKSMTIGEKIAYMRKKNGMTQADLGTKLNVSYQAVSKWERDESLPDFDMISRLSRLLGVSIAFFEAGATLVETTDNEQAKTDTEEKRAPKLLGVCKTCGKAVYEGEGGKSDSTGVYCSACARRKKVEEEEKRAEKERKEQEQLDFARGRKRKGLITASIVVAIGIVGGIMAGDVGATLLGAVFMFCFISQLFWNGAVVGCALAGGRRIGTPGIIFDFSWDGLKFLILMKILFALVRFAVWFFTVGVCLIAALFISPFTFIPALRRVSRGEIDRF